MARECSADELLAMLEEFRAVVFARLDVIEERVDRQVREAQRLIDVMGDVSNVVAATVRDSQTRGG